MTIVIYHANCIDGFAAAWAVRRAIGEDGVEYRPAHYGSAPPFVEGRDVIIVDFSYKRDVLHEIGAKARTLLVLDHHKTAAEDLAGFPPPLDGPYNPRAMEDWARECNAPCATHTLFDMNRSGAGIAWDYFHPGVTRPRLIDYVEDRDLWRFERLTTREFHSALSSHPFDFALWDEIAVKADVDIHWLSGFVREGAAIDRKHLMTVNDMIAFAQTTMVIRGFAVPAANLPPNMASDAGNIMAKGEPFAACYTATKDGWKFSLRSTDDGVDVSAIAKTFGGGGHRNAAGFTWRGDLNGLALA